MISVILLVRKDSAYLDECLESVTLQRYKDWELICIVEKQANESMKTIQCYGEKIGGSVLCQKDESEDINCFVWRDATEQEKIRLCFFSDSDETADVMNYAMKKARGKYLLFMHPEDFCQPDFFETGVMVAENNRAEVVVFETGERSPKTGVLRQRFTSLRTEILPDKELFSCEEVKGNYLRLVRFPTWLTLFCRNFLQELDLHFPKNCKVNNRWIGMCAIAAGKRICAVRTPLAYLHIERECFTDIAREMEIVQEFLRRKKLYGEAGYQFAHSVLADAVNGLKTSFSDRQRYLILNYLCSDAFSAMDILEKAPEWYRYGISRKNAAFISAACRRYMVTEGKNFHNTVEIIMPVRHNMEIKVSVIIPVYNSEAYLEATLQSAASQTIQQIEILCMDDGSTDSSMEILKRWAAADPRIGVFRQENAGPSVARNRLLDLARGEYIFFLDSDDILEFNVLQDAYMKADKESLELLAFNAVNFYDSDLPEDVKKVRSGKIITGNYEGICTGPELLARLQENGDLYSAAWLYLINRKFLLRSGIRFSEGDIHEDTPYSFALLLHAKRMDYLDKIVLKRRLRKSSITTGVKTFDHCYGFFRSYLAMRTIFVKMKQEIRPEVYGAIHYRLKWVIDAARERYSQMADLFIGEEYGLRDDFTQFYSLISSYCEQFRQEKEVKQKYIIEKNEREKTSADLGKAAKQLNITRQYLSNMEKQQQITKNKLSILETLLQETKKQLSHSELMLNETEGKLRNTEDTLKGTLVKLDETESALEKTQLNLTDINRMFAVTKETLKLTKEQLNGARVEISCLKKSVSFRVGRFITWPLRKIRDLFC